MKNRLLQTLSLLLIFLPACTKEVLQGGDAESSDSIMFSTRFDCQGSAVMTKSVGGYAKMDQEDWSDLALASGPSTKGSLTTVLRGDASLFAYQYDDTFSAAGIFMAGARYSFDGTDLTPQNPYPWAKINKQKVFFASYAPYSAAGITPTMYNGNPGVTYTVPATAADQLDVLYATSEVGSADFRKKVELDYNHALTAIQFRMGFDCKAKSVCIRNVKNAGTFTFANKWEETSGSADYTINFDGQTTFLAQQMLTEGENTLIVLPQSFDAASGAVIELVYDDNGTDKTISASLAGSSWVIGKKVVYTLYKQQVEYNYVYFDVGYGDIHITDDSYSGWINVKGTRKNITGPHTSNTKYYVFQSTYTISGDNQRNKTGYLTTDETHPESVTIPKYQALEDFCYGGKPWADYITGNSNVKAVYHAWADNAVALGRDYSSDANKYIEVSGSSTFDVTIDNLYLQCGSGAVRFTPTGSGTMTLRLKGNNVFPNILYKNTVPNSGRFIITSADGDHAKTGSLMMTPFKDDDVYDNKNIIGPNSGNCYGLEFRGGTVFAGIQVVKNAVWALRTQFNYSPIIGGGVNSIGEVTVNGGRITAVSNGTSAAIGGGGGYTSKGGPGIVTINGGEVYAYARGIYTIQDGYKGYVPAAAIGGAGTIQTAATNGTRVTITGGYVYAESLGGTAIGGGNSGGENGANAVVNISGDAVVYARSTAGMVNYGNSTGQVLGQIQVAQGSAIGGGSSLMKNGGDAEVNISGGRLVTGSLGGGKTGDATGKFKIGTAQINITGGEISAQFVMAKGSAVAPSFTMTGGTIFKQDAQSELYLTAKEDGGAVYMEAGTCTISGGTIRNCTAGKGGAVYMNGGTFTMTGGTIRNNSSSSNGGAVCVEGGDVTVSGGTISNNVAHNGNGGGVYVSGGSYIMPQAGTGVISTNSANSNGSTTTGNGGGIYIWADTGSIRADLMSGRIVNNTADYHGGGVYIDAQNSAASADITIGEQGGTPANPYINDNSAALSGGGLCVLGAHANVTIYSGTVKGHVSAHASNPDIRNDGGIVNLVGNSSNCDILFNTVRFNSNNSKGDVLEQRIVTNTNSKLAPPAGTGSWTKEFHVLKEWNTKADGSGVTYSKEGGELMVISEDVDLYAIWTPSVSGS